MGDPATLQSASCRLAASMMMHPEVLMTDFIASVAWPEFASSSVCCLTSLADGDACVVRLKFDDVSCLFECLVLALHAADLPTPLDCLDSTVLHLILQHSIHYVIWWCPDCYMYHNQHSSYITPVTPRDRQHGASTSQYQPTFCYCSLPRIIASILLLAQCQEPVAPSKLQQRPGPDIKNSGPGTSIHVNR